MTTKWDKADVAIALWIAPLIVAATVVWNSWPLMLLWNWFVVPMGAPAVTLAHAIGLMCVVFATRTRRVKDDRPTDWVAFGLAGPLLVAVGWVAKGVM